MLRITKTLARAAALIATLAPLVPARAMAADRIPQQFVGNWCIDQKASKATSDGIIIYRRSNRCREAEEQMIIQPNLISSGGESKCKLLETVSITRHGTHRFKFWCKLLDSVEGSDWIYEMFISPSHPPNEIATQDVKQP
jgi:hypothetical protein